MEILAPVGGQKQLNAAIAAGADAIYLGSNKFSARAGAENFSLEEIGEVVTRCHHENIKVYLTVNTLFKNSEIYDALNLCVDFINEGVDAIIIQDFGLTYLLESYYPEIEKHASTQMSIHNIEGAKFIKQFGISRIVLARELSLDEIREINNADIETEVFIHGAICISYSGQCLFSSLNGTRSANRGRCAQPCRKPYKLLKNDTEIDSGFLISPKDRSYIHDITKLRDIDVASYKIEGRLRNEYYVYESIRQYKNALHEKSYDLVKLEQIFKREDFSNTYLFNTPTSSFITKQGGSNKGIYLGKIVNNAVKLECDLELSDGIKSGSGGFILTKMLCEGKKVKSASKGDIVTLFPTKYSEGDHLFKTASFNQKREIEMAIENYKPIQLKIPVNVEFIVNKPLLLYNDDIKIEGSVVERALKKPLEKEKIIHNIEKSASKYVKLTIDTIICHDGYLKISDINDARRQFITEYERLKIKQSKNIEKKLIHKSQSKNTSNCNKKFIIIHKKSELTSLNSDFTVCLNPFSSEFDAITREDVVELDKKGYTYYVKLPTIIRSEFNEIYDFICSLHNIVGVVTANLGMISVLKDKMSIIGYYDLNIMNSYSIEFFDFLDFIIPSPELSKIDLEKLKFKDKLLPMIYGNIKYMNMEYCPIQDFDNNDNSTYYLEENGRKTIIKKDIFERITLYSHKALNHSYRIKEYREMGYSNFIIEAIEYDNFNKLLYNLSKEKGYLEEELIHYNKEIL